MRSVREVTIAVVYHGDSDGEPVAAAISLDPRTAMRGTLIEGASHFEPMRPTDAMLVDMVMAALEVAAERNDRY